MPIFSTRHYKTLAACLGGALAEAERQMGGLGDSFRDGVNDVLHRIELELELDNPKFDKQKFAKAVEEWREAHGGE